MSPKAHVLVILLTALFTALACAEGEHFGNSGGRPGSGGDVASCSVAHDCYDGDNGTLDLCIDGACYNVPDTGGMSAIPDGACPVEEVVDGDNRYEVDIPESLVEADPTTPISRGAVARISVKHATRLRILPTEGQLTDITFVLLSDCANSAANRLAWGDDLYSPTLQPGEYFLAVFGESVRTVPFDVRYLTPTSCGGAVTVEDGEPRQDDSVDSFADDFSGSCQPDVNSGHRGDRVYRIDVPPKGTWAVEAVVTYDEDDSPGYHLYLRRGCAGPDMAELACSTGEETGVTEADGPVHSHLRADGLEEGAYYLFVDAAEAELYSLGKYTLEVSLLVSEAK